MVNKKFDARWDFMQLSTDEKPNPRYIKVREYNTLYEMDTGDTYIFYEGEWQPFLNKQGTAGKPNKAKAVCNYVRKSTDKKPDPRFFKVEEGYLCYELDTGKIFIYNGSSWENFMSQEGGGGGGGGGNADFELNTTYDFATIQNQGQGMNFDFSNADGVTITASDPGTYYNSKILATQDYVDSKAGGTIDVVPSDDKFTVSDSDGLNSASLQVGGAGVLFNISGSEVAELTIKKYVDDRTALQTTEVYNENSTATDFNPVVTEYVKDGDVTYTKYRFYFRTGYLAIANSTKTFDFSTLMADYTVKEWTNISGFTDNGHKLSNGRTDNLGNVAILQQLGRSSKQLIIRSYGDLSSHTAILQLEFYGTKN